MSRLFHCITQRCASRFNNIKHSSSTASSSTASRLVVFDKDGTLLSFDKPWLAWCARLQARLVEVTASAVELDVSTRLGDMGVDMQHGKIGLGTFAECSQRDVRLELTNGFRSTLQRISEDENLTSEIIDSCRQEGDGKYPLGDIRALFQQLRGMGYSIAIATADCDKGVDMFLDDNSIDVDFVMCAANYTEFPPKPSKLSAEKLCRQFGVESRDVVMVGDTPTDIEFGLNGNFGLVVGVTTGIGTAEDLKDAGAHIVLDHISQLVSTLERFHVPNPASGTVAAN